MIAPSFWYELQKPTETAAWSECAAWSNFYVTINFLSTTRQARSTLGGLLNPRPLNRVFRSFPIMSPVIPHLSFRRTHDVLRVEGQQGLVVLEFSFVVDGSSQQLPKLLAVPVESAVRRGRRRRRREKVYVNKVLLCNQRGLGLGSRRDARDHFLRHIGSCCMYVCLSVCRACSLPRELL